MTFAIISPLAVAESMIVGPDSALKLKTMPEKLRNRICFTVEKMMDEEKTPYEIAEMVVLTVIMEHKELPNRVKALDGCLGTPMVIEAFLLRGMPNPYVWDQMERLLPDWMDERLLSLIPMAIIGKNGPEWTNEGRAQAHYVAQLLWNQQLLQEKKEGQALRVIHEHDRLRREFDKLNRKPASTSETSRQKA